MKDTAALPTMQELFRESILPASFFLGFAVLWTLQSSWMLQTNRRKEVRIRRWKFGCRAGGVSVGEAHDAGSTFNATPSLSSMLRSSSFLHLASDSSRQSAGVFCCYPRLLHRLPLEGVLKVTVSTAAMLAELCIALSGNPTEHVNEVLRATVYFFFGLSGFVDVMCHFRILYPRGSEYFVLGMAFTIEALLYNVPTGSSPAGPSSDLTGQLTQLLVWTILSCAVTTFVEMLLPQRTSLRLIRSFFTFLQGSWIAQRGILLSDVMDVAEKFGVHSTVEPSAWLGVEPQTRVPWITLLFCWHIASIFVCMSLVVAATLCVRRRLRQSGSSSTPVAFRGINRSRTCSPEDGDAGASRHTLGEDYEETAPLQP